MIFEEAETVGSHLSQISLPGHNESTVVRLASQLKKQGFNF